MLFIQLLTSISLQGNLPICLDIKKAFLTCSKQEDSSLYVDQSLKVIKHLEKAALDQLFELGALCSEVGSPKIIIDLCAEYVAKKLDNREELETYAERVTLEDSSCLLFPEEFKSALFNKISN